MWVALKIGKVIPDALVRNLIFEKVRLVEEEDDGDRPETSVIHNCVENIDALNQTICDTILE